MWDCVAAGGDSDGGSAFDLDEAAAGHGDAVAGVGVGRAVPCSHCSPSLMHDYDYAADWDRHSFWPPRHSPSGPRT